MKHINNNKGSILALVIIMLAVMSVIGTSVLGIAITNYKIKKANTINNNNLYLSESGLDVTYSYMYNLVNSAVIESNKKAKEEKDKYTDVYLLQAITDIENNPENITNYKYIIYSEESQTYSYKWEEIQLLVEKAFERTYRDNVQKGIEDFDGSDEDIEIGVIDPADNKTVLSIKDDSVKLTTPSSKVADSYKYDNLTLLLKSNKNDGSGNRKTSVNLTIKVPKYDDEYNKTEGNNVQLVNINNNPIWEKLIATDEDIIIDSNECDMTGDIFAKNNLNLKNGLFNINGISAIANNIQISNGQNKFEKSLFANNVIMSSSDSNLETKDVYIKDDLEMNSNGQTATIDGNYYGFSDGSDSEDPDNSSGIIINGDITELNLKGDVYINGTSYIQLAEGAYQTGESLSIKGNYRAYTTPLYKSKKYSLTDSDGNPNVTFKYFDPLTLIDTYKDNDSFVDFNVYSKAEYFMDYYKDSNDNKAELKSKIKINEAKKLITLGAFIYGEEDSINVGTGNGIDYQPVFKQLAGMYDINTKQLGDKRLVSSGNLDVSTEVSGSEDSILDTIESSDGKNEIYAVYNKNGGYKLENNTPIELDDNGDVTINLGSNPVYGVIVAEGNVNICGSGEFYGCIIAKKNVNLETGKDANLIYSRDTVIKALASSDQLRSIFTDRSGECGITQYILNGTIGVPSDQTEYNEKIGDKNYNQLLQLSNWKIDYGD